MTHSRWTRTTGLAALLLACLVGFAPPAMAGAKPAGGDHPKLDRVLNDRAAKAPGGKSRVIVVLNPGADASDLKKHGKLGRLLGVINGQVVELSNGHLKQLADSPAVASIHWDRPAKGAMNRVAVTVGARAVQLGFGYNGAGVGVAVIDSGIANWHDDFTYFGSDSKVRVVGGQRVSAFVDFVNGQTAPYDDFGHGTHVSGIIAANGFDSFGVRAGIAPAADIISEKVLDANGDGVISNVIAALDWALQNRQAYNIRVVNLSVGAPITESFNTDPLTLACKHAVDSGIVVVAAAGNFGRSKTGKTIYGAITAPGNAPWVLTVGASSTNGTVTRSDDTIAPYSSRGPTMIDRIAKPDVVAPGTGVVAPAAFGSTLYTVDAAYLLAGSMPAAHKPYLSLTGTSMAAPVVSGTVALMLQANPFLTPNAVKAIIEYTAEAHYEYDALTQGAGFLNTYGAVRLARFYRNPQPGDSMPSAALWSHQILWGNRRLKGGAIAPRGNAWALGTVWGALAADNGDNIVWGTNCGVSDPSCANVVWGTGSNTCDPTDPNCDNIVWGTSQNCDPTDPNCDNIVWGTTCDAVDCGDNIVWGTSENCDPTNPNCDNIVWGTTCNGVDCGDNIVWGTSCDPTDPTCDNIVWGTSCDPTDPTCDNIVWGTSCDPTDPTCDNIVWGTSVVCDPMDPTCDNIVWGSSGDQTPLYDDPDAPPANFEDVSWTDIFAGGL